MRDQTVESVLEEAVAVLRWTIGAVQWVVDHLAVLAIAAAIVAALGELVRTKLADAVSRDRVRFELTASRRFEPDAEQIWRYAAQLARASGSGPWWAPRRCKAVRIRLRADGSVPLAFSVEGPSGARHLLAASPYHQVQVDKAPPRRDKRRAHLVRAEFVVHGTPAAVLRDVPLEPDPLQPLVDAVADLRADLGDLAEICLDLQPVPMWSLKLRRRQLLAAARESARRIARRESRWAWQDAADVEDSWRFQLMQALSPEEARRFGSGRRLALPARPRPVDRDKTLGKLAEASGLVRIQLLVRCASDIVGRAEARLRHIEAGFDVLGGRNRIVMAGRRIGPWRYGADSWPRRKRFDHRWATGQVAPRRDNWVRISELAGLLKPPTAHCRLPLLPGELPVYKVGSPRLLPQGWHTGADGSRRLLATPLADSKFSVTAGKSDYGKSEKALVQALALAHGGHGLLYVDPHSDSWKRAAPYLAHSKIMSRIWRIDLTGHNQQARLGGWNPLGMDRGQKPHEVVRAVTDAFATVMTWNDATAPRAMTIFTKAAEALVAVNAGACAAGQPAAQATVFQIRTLLTDPQWRETVLRFLNAADPEAVRWWRTTFAALPADALPVVTNPLDRLAADPVTRAFLGTPTGSYDVRTAMDTGKVVWICPSASGPTDRLLVALLVQDLFRAGLSRRDLPEEKRREFHVFLDELISIDNASSTTIAEITEQLRKFGVRLHAMTQLLQRVSETTRSAILQNSTIISTTAGSWDAVRLVAAEWGGVIDPAEIADLPRFDFFSSLTVDGKRIGPLRLRGPEVSEVFRRQARPNKVTALHRAADTALDAQPILELRAIASTQDQQVAAFLNQPLPPGPEGGPGSGRPVTPSDELTRRRQLRTQTTTTTRHR